MTLDPLPAHPTVRVSTACRSLKAGWQPSTRPEVTSASTNLSEAHTTSEPPMSLARANLLEETSRSRSHNPKVAGSNPAPAIRKSRCMQRLFSWVYSAPRCARWGLSGKATAGGDDLHNTLRDETRMILATGAVTIGILVVATVAFIVLCGWLTDFLQHRGPSR